MNDTLGPQPPLAAVAVGGYGRWEMSPHSDIDLLLLVPARHGPPTAALRGLLYPLWDAGFEVGHATVTPKSAIERAVDLDAATSLLSARLVAGNETLFGELVDRRARWIKRNSRRLSQRIVDSVARRHEQVDRAGWTLAPDLKEDAGGLRDLHAIGWLAQLAGTEMEPGFSRPHAIFMAVREVLHVLQGRRFDQVRIDLQPSVADRLGFDGAEGRDELMSQVHSAARFVEYHGAAARQASYRRLTQGPARSGSMQRLSASVSVIDGQLHATPGSVSTRTAAMEVVLAAAATGRSPTPSSARQLSATFGQASPDRWNPKLLEIFLAILEADKAIHALELLDHLGAWPVLIPEWQHVRGLAQHDPYHRYTVDGHSFRVVAHIRTAIQNDSVARSAAVEAGSLDTLYLAALLHDIGKGTGRDHCVAGGEITSQVCERMGLEPGDSRTVVDVVTHHLLLVDTAARRDISDPSVIESVIHTIGDSRVARLLYVLSVADGMGTGPDGWSSWKASLVRRLYIRTVEGLETGVVGRSGSSRSRATDVARIDPSLDTAAAELLDTLPSAYREAATSTEMAEELALLVRVSGRDRIATLKRPGTHPNIVLAGPDRPGALARTAGVLALHRLGVLHAEAFSTDRGLALQRFVLDASPSSWERLRDDLEAAYTGILALDARLEQKIGDYRPSAPPTCEVAILEDESEHSTVVEVRSQDVLGLLYSIASALTGLDLDIQVAKIDTLGSRVVDVFYVRTASGAKLPATQTAEVENAISHRVRVFFGG